MKGSGEAAARLAAWRAAYGDRVLTEGDVDPDALTQLDRWLDDAAAAGIAEPNAMVLATASSAGQPAARTVLLKGLDKRGLVFYTNYGSAKADDLAENPRAEVVFPWHPMERQVRVRGDVAKVDPAESRAYFATRPRESRLGAWASAQSSVVADREALDAAYARWEEQWPVGMEVPMPPFWGGYRLVPTAVELWQGRRGRLHDRLRYRRAGAGAADWVLERLAP